MWERQWQWQWHTHSPYIPRSEGRVSLTHSFTHSLTHSLSIRHSDRVSEAVDFPCDILTTVDHSGSGSECRSDEVEECSSDETLHCQYNVTHALTHSH